MSVAGRYRNEVNSKSPSPSTGFARDFSARVKSRNKKKNFLKNNLQYSDRLCPRVNAMPLFYVSGRTWGGRGGETKKKNPLRLVLCKSRTTPDAELQDPTLVHLRSRYTEETLPSSGGSRFSRVGFIGLLDVPSRQIDRPTTLSNFTRTACTHTYRGIRKIHVVFFALRQYNGYSRPYKVRARRTII